MAANFQELVEKAKEMQKLMQQAQGKITSLHVTGKAGGELVTVTMNGLHVVSSVKISPTLLGEDEDMLEDLVMAAINDAVRKIEEHTKREMLLMAKDIKLPEGLDDTSGSTGKSGD